MAKHLVQISHDGFAREFLMREQVDGSCDWCGQRNRYGKVFAYYTEPEGIYTRANRIRGGFCSVGCMRAYHN